MNIEKLPRINLDEPDYNSGYCWEFILAAIVTSDKEHIIKTVIRMTKGNFKEGPEKKLEERLKREIIGTGLQVKVLMSGSLYFTINHFANAGKKAEINTFGGFQKSHPMHAIIAQILEGAFSGLEALDRGPRGD